MATCKVYGYLFDGSDMPLPYVKIVAFPSDAPVLDSSSGRLISAVHLVASSTSTGYFELNLTKNVNFCINIKEVGFKEVVRVPDQEELSLWGATAVPDNPADPVGPENW